jgi:hypothetical protein
MRRFLLNRSSPNYRPLAEPLSAIFAEIKFYRSFAMRIIWEFQPERNIWVLIPTVILFTHGSAGNYTDLTLSWICFGISLRFGENKNSKFLKK